jgi:cell division protein FtsB
VLAGVTVVLALLITPQLRDWWVQQRTLSQLRQGIASSQREVDALRAERTRWEDPDYVRAQARERLHFVMPGETGFAVTGGSTRAGDGASSQPGDRASAPKRPWYGTLWASVQQAGDPGDQDGRLSDQQLIDRQPSSAVPPSEVLVDQERP